MPSYRFRCKSCNYEFDDWLSKSGDPNPRCPMVLEMVIKVPHVHPDVQDVEKIKWSDGNNYIVAEQVPKKDRICEGETIRMVSSAVVHVDERDGFAGGRWGIK